MEWRSQLLSKRNAAFSKVFRMRTIPRLLVFPDGAVTPVLSGTICRFLLFFTLAGSLLPHAQATIPAAASADPLYAKGYLVVTLYPGVFSDGTNAATTTAGLNEAIDDAYANNLVAYLPPGTYLVNDTLTATTKTGWDGVTDDFATPRNHIAIIGSTAGGSRPLIRLAPGAAGFSDPTSPKPVVEFRNLDKNNTGNEIAGEGYHQMLRGVDLDCSGQAGAIALYFNNAQNSSIENVRITATGAFTGLRGLPNAGTGVVNIEIEGGRYGIDDVGAGGSGSVIAGAVLRNQTITAVRHQSFAPLTFVGFEIVTAPGSTTAAVTVDPGFDQANFAALSFVDGVIRLGGAPAVAAIDNRSGSGKNFYARNVYVTGADALVRSGAQPVVSGTGTWKSINEYSCCNQVPVNFEKISMDLIDGVTTRAPGPLSNGEVVSIDDDASALPSDLPRLLRRGAGGLALIGLGFRDVGKIKRAHNSSNFVPLTRLNVLPIGADVQRHALQDGTTLRVTAGRAGSTLAARTVSRGARQSWNKERT